jgi:vacuolar-type H+-ATPase subunit I/STV1
VAPTDPENTRPLAAESLLSLEGGQRLMEEASNAIAAENYDLASQKLQEARQVFNQLSNFYSQLAASFSGIDNRLADSQRTKALDTAQMRDRATYQLALVHRAQNQPELAVPLLVQIISSQQPTRELGQKAYQQLLELGFVDVPYPRAEAQPQ